MASVPSHDNLHIEGDAPAYSSKANSNATLERPTLTTFKQADSQDQKAQHQSHSLNKERPLNPVASPLKNFHAPEAEPSSNSYKTKQKALSPINISDDHYKEQYYKVLEEGGNFKRKQGIFSDFSVKNKVTIEQMKHDRSPKRDHNRYMSKPVLFTALDTRNKLSESVALTHNQLLANRPKKFINIDETDEVLSTSKSKRVEDPASASPLSNQSRGHSITLPQIQSTKNSKNNTILSPYGFHGSTKSYSPDKSQDLSFRSPTLELNNPEFYVNLTDSKLLSSMSGKSISKYLGENYSILDSIKRANERNPMETSKLNKHDLHRYKTKKLTDSIFKEFHEKTKLDGEKYLEHTNDSVYKIHSSIALSKFENEKSLVRKNPINPIAYTPETGTIVYRDPTTTEQLSKFDENLLGWAKSIPNFGKQRWTYDPHWKFSLI